ncbi:MAG: hypothetical protein E6Q36_02685 [Chryseobacterium sp.]|nr:MAG: hypothetical protein E6Q36_02685 [Chryseobacterium sp.]
MSSERVEKLILRLGEMEESDIKILKPFIARMIEEKWTDSEILSYCRLTEHVNPSISEESACSRMEVIRKKVADRLKNDVP